MSFQRACSRPLISSVLGLVMATLPGAGCGDDRTGVPDAGRGATSGDTGVDVSSDAATDIDSGSDAGRDAAVDLDAGSEDAEVGLDSGSDAASDSGVEADVGTDSGTDGGTDSGPPAECVPGASRIFVTDERFNANLRRLSTATTGPEAGDEQCQAAATAAGLGGTWRAWLSDSTTNAIDRITDEGPWYLVDRCTLVFASKANISFGPANPIMMTETSRRPLDVGTGINVWTGSSSTGVAEGGNCEGWGTTSGFAAQGEATRTTSDWTYEISANCVFNNRLYCFEQ